MQVLGQINQRFDELTGEITIEVRKQCETTKQAAADMVKTAAKRTFDGQLELGRQLAEAEFMRQVAEQKIRGERMFQVSVLTLLVVVVVMVVMTDDGGGAAGGGGEGAGGGGAGAAAAGAGGPRLRRAELHAAAGGGQGGGRAPVPEQDPGGEGEGRENIPGKFVVIY